MMATCCQGIGRFKYLRRKAAHHILLIPLAQSAPTILLNSSLPLLAWYLQTPFIRVVSPSKNSKPLSSTIYGLKLLSSPLLRPVSIVYLCILIFCWHSSWLVVTLVSAKTSHDLGISSQLLTVLGTVLGLVISFRTSSAYERYVRLQKYWCNISNLDSRYQDGRKMWTNITTASRNLAQQVAEHLGICYKTNCPCLQDLDSRSCWAPREGRNC